jgi:hypothetical protein
MTLFIASSADSTVAPTTESAPVRAATTTLTPTTITFRTRMTASVRCTEAVRCCVAEGTGVGVVTMGCSPAGWWSVNQGGEVA